MENQAGVIKLYLARLSEDEAAMMQKTQLAELTDRETGEEASLWDVCNLSSKYWIKTAIKEGKQLDLCGVVFAPSIEKIGDCPLDGYKVSLHSEIPTIDISWETN